MANWRAPEVSRTLGLSRGRLTQVMRLLQLAPEIQERLLTGGLDWSERRLRRVVREPCWGKQLAICGEADEEDEDED